MKKGRTTDSSSLRLKAEERVKSKPSKPVSQLSEAKALKLILELEVHQIELEMQNEELNLTISAAQDAIALYDFAPSGYFTLSKDGEIIKLNLCSSQMLGKERPHLINSKLGFFVSDDTKPIFNLFLGKIFARRARESCEVTLVNSDRSLIYVLLTGIATENGDQCLVTMLDITGHKRGEEALAVSEANYRRLFESAKDGILIIEAETGKIMDVNPFLIELSGYSQGQFIGKEIWETGFFKDIAVYQDKFLELQQKKYCHYENLPLLTAQGRQINIELVSNFYLVNKKMVIQCNIRDITTRRQTEEALRGREKRYLSLLNNLDAGIVIHAPDTSIIVNNPKASELLGLSENQLNGKSGIAPRWKFLTENNTPLPIEEYPVNQIIAGKQSIKNFLMGVDRPATKDVVWLLVNGLPVLDNNGEIAEILISFIDITERKLVEAEIKLKNEELFKINAEKDKFFSIIAHDLRSPFTGFLGLTEIMVGKLTSMTYEEIKAFSLVLKNSASDLFRLLENLLEWSRMQRGLTSFVPATFLLLPKISESMILLLEAANNKKLVISYDIPDDLSVFADGNMLGSIIRNLVTNAVKFTPNGGHITISARSTSENTDEVSVRDTGIGMNKNMIKNLFRLDVNTNRKGTEGESSTGLGLMICKDFVEKHGGKLSIESLIGKGSIIYFTIPSKGKTD